MRRQWHRIWEIPQKRSFIVKGSFGSFIGLGKLSCCRNDFGWYFLNWRSLLACCKWWEVPVNSYLAFGQLTGCFGQFSYSLWVFMCFLCLYHCSASDGLKHFNIKLIIKWNFQFESHHQIWKKKRSSS